MKDRELFIPPKTERGSPLHGLMAQARGKAYRPLESLWEALQDPQGVVVLEGDRGGQIYVVCPARLVRCSEEELEQLLRDIDALEWNEPELARLYFERLPTGAIVPGGMGGGLVTQDVWVHEKLKSEADSVRAVIIGMRKRLLDEDT